MSVTIIKSFWMLNIECCTVGAILWAVRCFGGCVKSKIILLHPIILPKQWYLTWQECVFGELLPPTYPHARRPQLELMDTHTLTHTHSLTLSLYYSPGHTLSFTLSLSLSSAHTHNLIHKGDWLHSCSISKDTTAFSASGEVFVPMSEAALLPKVKDEEKH